MDTFDDNLYVPDDILLQLAFDDASLEARRRLALVNKQAYDWHSDALAGGAVRGRVRAFLGARNFGLVEKEALEKMQVPAVPDRLWEEVLEYVRRGLFNGSSGMSQKELMNGNTWMYTGPVNSRLVRAKYRDAIAAFVVEFLRRDFEGDEPFSSERHFALFSAEPLSMRTGATKYDVGEAGILRIVDVNDVFSTAIQGSMFNPVAFFNYRLIPGAQHQDVYIAWLQRSNLPGDLNAEERYRIWTHLFNTVLVSEIREIFLTVFAPYLSAPELQQQEDTLYYVDQGDFNFLRVYSGRFVQNKALGTLLKRFGHLSMHKTPFFTNVMYTQTTVVKKLTWKTYDIQLLDKNAVLDAIKKTVLFLQTKLVQVQRSDIHAVKRPEIVTATVSKEGTLKLFSVAQKGDGASRTVIAAEEDNDAMQE